MDIQTNVYPVLNIADLGFRYDTYRIRNLRRDQDEYFQNKEGLVRILSFKLGAPVQVVEYSGAPFLIVPNDTLEVPEKVSLVRTVVYLEPTARNTEVDFSLRTSENDAICLRIVQFILQAPLWNNNRLWQPSAGGPFFEKQVAEEEGGLGRYPGFSVRAVVGPSGRIGLCVDVRSKFLRTEPIPVRLDRLGYRRFDGKRCVYRYGHRWYEIRVDGLSDLTVSEEEIYRGAKSISLLEYITDQCRKPLPGDLAALPHDASVLRYRNNRGEDRGAAAGLCYPVCDNQQEVARRLHSRAIVAPDSRHAMINLVVQRYLKSLRFKEVVLRVGDRAERVPRQRFVVPDIEFGNGCKLSVRGTNGTNHVKLENLGSRRISLLRRGDVGFFIRERFRRQYLVLPESVFESWGSQYILDLRRTVDELYPDGGGYRPEIVTYRDRGPRTYRDQGAAIVDSLKDHLLDSAYASVMVHRTKDRRLRDHDSLAAMVIRELRERDIYGAVNHSEMGQRCYIRASDGNGKPCYEISPRERSRFLGYLRNVALNKILLTNGFWPFVLASKMHADVTIGIDVKNQTAGFTVVGSGGAFVRTVCSVSRQKEKLLKAQVTTHVTDLLRDERVRLGAPLRAIVIHRDGRCWQSEIDGAGAAISSLKREGVVASDGTLTILEIAKSAPVRLRLFDFRRGHRGQTDLGNPEVGTYAVINGMEGFLCCTGRAFPRRGSVQPLHVRCVTEGLPFREALEDVYALTTLAWTRPEDCSRYPITLKLTDRWLGEEASEFDEDSLRYIEEEEQEPERRASA